MKKIETLVADLQKRCVNDEVLNKLLTQRENLQKRYAQFNKINDEKQKQSATMLKASLDNIEVKIRARIKELLKANRTEEEKTAIANRMAKMKEAKLKKRGLPSENDQNDDYFHKEKWNFGI